VRRCIRPVAWALGGIVCALAIAALVVQAAAERRVSRVREVEVQAVSVPGDAASLARGSHLVEVVGQCTTCHGDDLSGRPMADDPWLGRLHAPNLTPGAGGLSDRSDLDVVRAIRFGVKRDGRPVLMMPSQYFFHFSDADLGAIIAYLRSVPPVDALSPPRRVGPFSALAIVTGQVPDIIPAELIERGATRMAAPPPAPSPAYGAYLVETGGCKVCHHEDLSGGLHTLSLPDEPPPTDLTPGGPLARWSEADFLRTLRTGVTPEGRRLDPAWMPWPSIARMSDVELRAIWSYLRSLSGAAEGSVQGQTEDPLDDRAA
jgi:mono/diheme cytochrome c family protein